MSNSYSLAKVLFDLEKVDMFYCARLVELDDSKRIYYDSFLNKECENEFIYKYLMGNIKIRSVSGVSYDLTYYIKRNGYALVLELLAYCLLIISWIFLFKYYNNLINSEKLKLTALELENKMISEFAKQISHDVASPLSAIRIVTSLLKNIDPEVQDVLEKSVERTQLIFDSLKAKAENSEFIQFDCLETIKEIVSEKNILWNKEVVFSLNYNKDDIFYCIGDSTQFKRILSNIFNNSKEAFNIKSKKIEIELLKKNSTVNIKIADNGKGMPDNLINILGLKKVSFGKEKCNDSGAGIGLYDACKKIKEWGGSINFKSAVGLGTTIDITLIGR